MDHVVPLIAADALGAGAAALPEVGSALRSHVEECRCRLLAQLRATREGTLVADYFARGKMLRALLVFASSSAVRGNSAQAMYAAEAIELLHAASLFHDDVIDGADERRGLPALHSRVSYGGAIVLGDLLVMRAFGVLCEARVVVAPDTLLDALALLSTQAQACCHGQYSELELTGQPASEREYLAIAAGKTASPFVAAAGLGALFGGASMTQRHALETYALHLGIAFQICDDMLDIVGDRAVLGKPTGNSLARRRPVLPAIYLERDGSPAARAAWMQLQGRDDAVPEILALLRREGVEDRVSSTQKKHISAARASLDGLPDTEVLQTLRELTAIASKW